MKGVGAASRLFELQDRKPLISPTGNYTLLLIPLIVWLKIFLVGNPVTSARGTIKFEDVVFSYPTRPAVNIFDGLNFEIPPGTNVAIVGSSGGGKSTISE